MAGMRIGGLATGLDTDTMVKQMMQTYTMKVDKLKQDKQIVTWRQELYRDIIAEASSISKTYFDILKPGTNMLSKNNYAGFDATSANTVVGQSAGVNATASLGAVVGNYTVEVTQLASAAMVEGTAMSPDITNLNKYTTKLDDLGVTDGTLSFEYKNSSGVTETREITVSKDATISQLMDAVNKGTSGFVKLNFSELTRKFSIEGLQTGSSSSLNVTEGEGTNILTELNLSSAVTPGKDAIVKITPPGTGATGVTVTKPSNSFSIDGVNYTLTKAGTTNNITIAANTQKTFDKIKDFIDKYNELVDKISRKTSEKKQYNYFPLTDEQKTEMSEDEIKQWDIKAKEGLLKGDSGLENMINAMRTAFYEEVKGAGIALTDIGLSTSSDISQRGKIIIDETKLKTAIGTRGEQIANLFTKTSTTHPSYSADYLSGQRSVRSEEQGIFHRINDILQDYTRTTRNKNGKKGILLEKAGLKGDVTEFQSSLSKDIIKKDKMINEMIKSLSARENKFYLQFSRLEVAMNKLNSQSSWLTQQFSAGQ